MADVETGELVNRFRSTFGEAPELTNKVEFPTEDANERTGVKKVLYTLTSLDGPLGKERATFIAGVDLRHNLIRVEYERMFGLRVRRELNLAGFPDRNEWELVSELREAFGDHTQFSEKLRLITDKRRTEKDNLLLGEGNLTCNLGEVQVVYQIRYPGWPLFVTEPLLANPHNLRASILVLSSQQDQGVPLAQVQYHASKEIDFTCDFPCGDYDQVLTGQIDKRLYYVDRKVHQYTYFQWEYLLGAKLGFAKFKDGQSGDLRCEMSIAKIGRHYRQPQSLRFRSSGHHRFADIKDSGYEGKICRLPSNDSSNHIGNLQLTRRNKETGELWELTVPGAIDINSYRDAFLTDSFDDFLFKYPVVFDVRKPSEKRKTFSTWNIPKYYPPRQEAASPGIDDYCQERN